MTAVLALGLVAAPFGDDDKPSVVLTQPAATNPEPEPEPEPETETTTTTSTTVEPTTTIPPTTTTTVTTTTIPPTTTTLRPATVRPSTTAAPKPATTTTTVKKPASSSCHSSYTRTCIPPDVSDADCAGGSGNGPWYVREKDIGVVGPDVFDLDRDGDGVGCES